jgi:hypothetical protein
MSCDDHCVRLCFFDFYECLKYISLPFYESLDSAVYTAPVSPIGF